MNLPPINIEDSHPGLGFFNIDFIGREFRLLTDQNDLIRALFFLVLGIAGLVFFAMLIIGGFRYLTAGGDEKAAAEGQKTLTRAFMGLVIMIAAVLILQLFIAIFGLQGTTVTVD